MTEPNTDRIAEILTDEQMLFFSLGETKEQIRQLVDDYKKMKQENTLLESQLTAAQALLASVQDDLTKQLYDKTQECEGLRKALEEIACYDDVQANGILADKRSYSLFDEPNAVRTARQALEGQPPKQKGEGK